jgi:hypothetical protein
MDAPIDEDVRPLTDDEVLTVGGGSIAEVIDAIGKGLTAAARGGGGDDSTWTFLPWR